MWIAFLPRISQINTIFFLNYNELISGIFVKFVANLFCSIWITDSKVQIENKKVGIYELICLIV